MYTNAGIITLLWNKKEVWENISNTLHKLFSFETYTKYFVHLSKTIYLFTKWQFMKILSTTNSFHDADPGLLLLLITEGELQVQEQFPRELSYCLTALLVCQ